MRDTTIQITLGTFAESYVIGITGAPAAYDGGGTIELRSKAPADHDKRLVLIPLGNKSWQTARYSSGMYGFTAYPDGEDYDERDTLDLATRALTERFDRGGSK